VGYRGGVVVYIVGYIGCEVPGMLRGITNVEGLVMTADGCGVVVGGVEVDVWDGGG
jgi:hypothetical protein